ncbi:Glyoxalase/bleomycin resistance protein/dioxygenase [Beutenbergia cavernae DSM 12333]|uniref:Glyoxalase/bleomycin resistance protein/dioxygenase n=1 Tax=Beutenbergia cavernae (strain ATCC BAA-8 / DSM 12333 / CCUG 43141 / JCM 11478 / NBRC 16432 / NCIMB 13614 / HKI 0122) TaxID=471853 RepID=C5BY18_BEUC1|nr:VOC family protein [Beutenbergia cavernae]ACQ78912.1 Glyoxalase/bleomycin resistance protein/dioxygenase [Beutenbergia cavernae DSM 12333]
MDTTTSTTTPAPAPMVWQTLGAHDPAALLAVLTDVLGFVETLRTGTDGAVQHAELAWPEGGGVMLGPERGDEDGNAWSQRAGTAGTYLVSERLTALWDAVRAAGLDVLVPLTERDYGGRTFAVRDAEGNLWSFGEYRGAPVPDLAPHVHVLRVPTGPQEAFDAFALRLGEWWHPSYTADSDTFAGVTIEPEVGGAVVEHHAGGREIPWGTVTTWDPGAEVAFTFSLALPEGVSSEVRVRFEPAPEDDGAGTMVRFVHGGWTAENAQYRGKFAEWPVILERYAALLTPS